MIAIWKRQCVYRLERFIGSAIFKAFFNFLSPECHHLIMDQQHFPSSLIHRKNMVNHKLFRQKNNYLWYRLERFIGSAIFKAFFNFLSPECHHLIMDQQHFPSSLIHRKNMVNHKLFRQKKNYLWCSQDCVVVFLDKI